MSIENVPPHDQDAEMAVLGSMLVNKKAIDSAAEILKKDDFYRQDNSIIFEAMLNIYNKAEPVDIITLKAELSSIGKLDEVGGIEYIAKLPD